MDMPQSNGNPPTRTLTKGISMDMTVPSFWTNPIFNNLDNWRTTPKWMKDIDVTNPDSPYFQYCSLANSAEAREVAQAELDAAGEGKKWYSDCYIPPAKSPEPIVACSFFRGLAVPSMISSTNFPGEKLLRAAQANPLEHAKLAPSPQFSRLPCSPPRSGPPATPVVDGIHVKSDLQKKREQELAEKQARRDRALTAAKAAAEGDNALESMPPPTKSASDLRAEKEDSTTEFVSDMSSALMPSNIAVGKKGATVKIPAKKVNQTKANSKNKTSGLDSGYLMTTIEESWAGSSGYTRTVEYGLEPLQATISNMNPQTIRLVQVKHADGKFEGFISGIEKNETQVNSMSFIDAVQDCKEWLKEQARVGFNERLGIDEVNETLQAYDPKKIVSSHFPKSAGRYNIFVYGNAKAGLNATVGEAKGEGVTSQPASVKKTGGRRIVQESSSSDSDSSDSDTGAYSQQPTSLKRKYDQKGAEDTNGSKRKKLGHNHDDHTTQEQHTLPTPPLPPPLPSKAPSKPKTNKRKAIEDEHDDEQQNAKPERKKAKPTAKRQSKAKAKAAEADTEALSELPQKMSEEASTNAKPKVKRQSKAKAKAAEEGIGSSADMQHKTSEEASKKAKPTVKRQSKAKAKAQPDEEHFAAMAEIQQKLFEEASKKAASANASEKGTGSAQ